MGNICSVTISCDAIFSRCVQCFITKASYISQLEDNLVRLQSELQKLIHTRNDVLSRVIFGERPLKMKRTDQVQGWLSRVQAAENQVAELQKLKDEETQKLCFGGYCSNNCKSSYNFGKRVHKMLQDVTCLQREGDFKNVAEKIPEAPVDEIPIDPTIVGLPSTFDKVWTCLGDQQAGIIGLYGMRGVGKTTLLTQINNKFLDTPNDFDVVLWVVVSKDQKLEMIQETIGKRIGLLDCSWKTKRLEEKALDIFKVLSQKRFVLLLDDIWERVDLIKVGVPLPSPKISSKIVFTSRFNEVCSHMEAHKQFRVECLAHEEAWKLFRMKVGRETLDNDPDILEIACEIEKEKGKFLVQTSVGLTETLEIEKWEGVKRMSLMENQIDNLFQIPSCPDLLTLFLNKTSLKMINNDFFRFMPSLKVLNLSSNILWAEFPLGISRLVSLQHLDLSGTGIKELPDELKALANLRCLNLGHMYRLHRVPRRLISSFAKLCIFRLSNWELGPVGENILSGGGEYLTEQEKHHSNPITNTATNNQTQKTNCSRLKVLFCPTLEKLPPDYNIVERKIVYLLEELEREDPPT
ncbi:hypothetical protein EZV62_004219 [Acer yangbiense]|uniref:NB-ARC domain-containing protein n=1 Tax=Acer yangbiense TaxID=1000413 RepID=A0A5C7IK84_9ROSI|nr:hypothetical protein EZV62_004219 [Acer yangbiense]